MTVSKFMQSGRTYINEAAAYLEARGVMMNVDVSIVPYMTVNMGYLLKRGNLWEPFLPEGWAFRIKDENGDYYDDRHLLRTCNWPDEDIYQRRRGEKEPTLLEKRPKFLHVGPKGADLTHFASTLQDLSNSPVIMFHEKFTSAALAIRHLGIPSVALSGCTNWSQNRALRASLRRVVELALANATIYVCFDADMESNPDVKHAAVQLQGWIKGLRPDLKVIFPIVPEMADGRNGWDDWAVDQGQDPAPAWLALLQEQGYEVTPAMPIGWLIEKFALNYRTTKTGIEIEHTSDNYMKLLTHEQWADWGRNIDNTIINADTLEVYNEDAFILDYEAWLQSNVFNGSGAGVRRNMVEAAVMRRLRNHKLSGPHLVLEAMEEVTEEEAIAAAKRMITDGIRVVAPMTEEENVTTLLRICRDLCGLWAVDPDLSAQWMLALVGPSGSGKSNWPERLLAFLTDAKIKWQPAEVPKLGGRADPTEYKRLMRDNLICMLDEYEPDDITARTIEQQFFSLSTKRTDSIRDPYQRVPATVTLRAGIILTTVDTNRCFIRSARGAGAERRFIIWEVAGVVRGPDGYMTSDRPVVEECGRILMRYGWQMWRDGVSGSANEFSAKYAGDYIAETNVTSKISMSIQSINKIEEDMLKWGEQWRIADVVRVTEKMLTVALCMGTNLSRGDRKDFHAKLREWGAEIKTGDKVTKLADGKAARNVVEVRDWPKFCQELFANLR